MNKVKQIEDLKCRNYKNINSGSNTAVVLFNNNNLPIKYDDDKGLFGIFNLFCIVLFKKSPNFARNPSRSAFYILFTDWYTCNLFIVF
jgi:hypothetical protein